MADSALTPDIYGITDHINNLKKDYFSANEESLMTGTLGYLGSIFAEQWQNQIIMTAQYSNEAIPTKAKFKRNIITHALSLDDAISLTATPAVMDIQLFLLEKEVKENLNKNDQFIIDCTQPIYVADFEFHLDYDLIITRTKIQDGYVYTARYKDIGTNPVSDIIDPYLRPPVLVDISGDLSIMVLCQVRQVSTNTITKKIMSSSYIENKTFSFEFEDQLAAFNITAIDGDTTRTLKPVYIGMYDSSLTNYFYYEYLDDRNIRIKFDTESYMPKINSIVQVNVSTTKGAAGIFKYNGMVTTRLKSSIYGYSNVTAIIRPATESTYGGHDSKTVAELKTLIPKEALSRGNIATSTDLNNYFDLINSTDSKLYFSKKRHNQFDLLFYSHFIFRDNHGNILPTNTIKIALTADEFSNSNNGKLVLDPGTIIEYNPTIRVGHVITEEQYKNRTDNSAFYYTTPFSLVVNQDPLYASYYLNIINSAKLLEFTWVNQESEVQFICSTVDWTREYSDDKDVRNQYTMSLTLAQNIMAEKNIVVLDEETKEISEVNMKVFAVFYNKEGVAYRYRELELDSYNDSEFSYIFKATFNTSNVMTKDDKLVVWGMSDIGNDNADSNYGDFTPSPKVVIYTATKYSDGSHGINELTSYVPGMEAWTVTNKYTVIDSLDFFYNYSDIISSTVTVGQDGNGKTRYTLAQVPMIRYEYLKDLDNLYEFIDQMEIRRQYIDDCLDKLEGAMGIDFKFYNTYGPSETYYIDGALIDKVNISMKFRTKILAGADKYIKDYIIQDIKEYVENIETIRDLHMPNITTLIEQKYADQIQYFQFVGINNYDTSIQHITKLDILEAEQEEHVPELLNVDVNDDGSPMIELIVDL